MVDQLKRCAVCLGPGRDQLGPRTWVCDLPHAIAHAAAVRRRNLARWLAEVSRVRDAARCYRLTLAMMPDLSRRDPAGAAAVAMVLSWM